MEKDELLERYQALGEESDYLAARPLFEQELSEQEHQGEPDALLLRQYGYLLECHGRYSIRRAIQQYERAMDIAPGQDKVRYQWIGAKASLGEADDVVSRHQQRVADAPGNVRELRFLASAHLSAGQIDAASEVIDAGLEIAADDWALIAARGKVRAARGDADRALADWRRALEIDPDGLSVVYSSAFLLEREGRLAEAIGAWQHILDHSEAHGWELDAAWPRQEIRRIRGLLEGD